MVAFIKQVVILKNNNLKIFENITMKIYIYHTYLKINREIEMQYKF